MRSKSNRAAAMAQELGSGNSWANAFVPSTPVSPVTPGDTSTDMAELAGSPVDLPPAYEDVAGDAAQQRLLQRQPPPPLTAFVGTKMATPEPIQTTTDTIASAIAAAQLDPRRSHVRHETGSSITGTYTFFDYLELKAMRGSIDIVLDPQPGTKPCILNLEATYGAIKVVLSEEFAKRLSEVKHDDIDSMTAFTTAASIVCGRPWFVSVRSKHGAIECRLPLGMGSNFFLKSRLGAIHATFYAIPTSMLDPEVFSTHHQPKYDRYGQQILSDDNNEGLVSVIKTETHHGAQEIKVTAPSISKKLHVPAMITNLVTDFWVKQHGSLYVHYPKMWRGRVQARTKGGEARIDGDDFDLQHFGKRELHGYRLNGIDGAAGSGVPAHGHMTVLRCDGNGCAKFSA